MAVIRRTRAIAASPATNTVDVSVTQNTISVPGSIGTAKVDVKVIRPSVAINASGPPGPQGAVGPQGPQGPPGSSGSGGSAGYVHNQPILASTWTVIHNLGKHPAVFVEDQGGSAMYGTIQYLDNDTLTITFFRSTTGKANCT